jgi:hypothetical protein
MNKNFKYFFDEFGPPVKVTEFSVEQLGKYKGLLPDSLLEFWSEAGWSGYADGLFWSTEPAQFLVPLEAWLEDSGIPHRDTYHVIARSAFGDLFAWGKESGASVIINPLFSSVTIKEPNENVKQGKTEAALTAFFVSKTKEYLDFEDYKGKPLFKRALKKLGPLQPDEMYAFEPALCLGGLPKLENLVKVKMIEHLVLLSQLAEIDYSHIDA